MTDDLRYPLGRFTPSATFTRESRARCVDILVRTPDDLRAAVQGLSDAQLDEPYRPGGWTIRQVVHHVPDSHVNAYIRAKLALTEDGPTIKPYDEAAWARLEDSRTTPIETSLTFLDVVHQRWVRILRAMTDQEFSREFVHPEHGRRSLNWLLELYAWHGPHHVAHVTRLRERMGWT